MPLLDGLLPLAHQIPIGRVPHSRFRFARISLCLVTPGLVARVIAAPELEGLTNCLSSALTVTDKQTCRDRYYPKIEHKLHMPAGSLDRYSHML